MPRKFPKAGSIRPESKYIKRFINYVTVDKETGCWVWNRSLDPYGYGQFSFRGRHHKAHRFAWRWIVGDIPEDMTLDHLCRNRACANPDHLEAVTLAENIARGESPSAKMARKTHCDKCGKPLEVLKMYNSRRKQGKQTRGCIDCIRKRNKESYRKAR